VKRCLTEEELSHPIIARLARMNSRHDLPSADKYCSPHRGNRQ
jgi:hypothetical protein